MPGRVDDIWRELGTIADPEIPVVSLVDLQIIRDIEVTDDRVVVRITPTFLGCPALEYMKNEIREKLKQMSFGDIQIVQQLSPPWSTDLLSAESKEKLRRYGIAPPESRATMIEGSLPKVVACPFCESNDTRLETPFGPTLCRQIYYCEHCKQSFERFKTL
jgi:ring-1,2-phenylacetyl-CoA epoxidase subunit PaaD